jgi:hypothetical protein
VDPIEEQLPHQILTDEETLEAAITVDRFEIQEEDADAERPYVDLSSQEQAIALNKARAIYEGRVELTSATELVMRALRKVKQDIRSEILMERQQKERQTLITSY